MIWGFVLLTFLPNCTDSTPVRLHRTDRSRIDTLFLAQVDTLKVFTDSSCVALKEEYLQTAVDSIIKLRKVEAEQLKNRYNEVLEKSISK